MAVHHVADGTIYRRADGVTTVVGRSPDDVAYLQGMATATDRAWQLDGEHRRSSGRLAEVFGQQHVAWDALARQLQLAQLAQRAYQQAAQRYQDWLAAYSAGVNRGLDRGARTDNRFDSHGQHPMVWQPWTPLAVMLSHHVLLTNFPAKLFREHCDQAGLGMVMDSLATPASGSGSNAWFVAADRTPTGVGPLLAADPHRVYEADNVYQPVRLVCDDFDVMGLAFPGVPGVPHCGHNGHVAWTTTSAMANAWDLFEEQVAAAPEPADAASDSTPNSVADIVVLGPTGAEPVTTTTEQVAVAGGEDVPVRCAVTERGPLVSLGGKQFSVRFPAWVESRVGVERHLDLLQARSTGDAVAAVASWVEPVNRMMVCDLAGDAQSVFAGLVPQRHAMNLYRPVPADDSRYQWTGEYLVSEVSKLSDVVAHANEATHQPEVWSVDFCAPHRQRRIAQLAAQQQTISVADCVLWQWDSLVPLPRWWTNVLALVQAEDWQLAQWLRAWDGDMAAGSEQAVWFAAVRDRVVSQLVVALEQVSAVRQDFGAVAAWLDYAPWVAAQLDELLQRGRPELPSTVDVLYCAVQDVLSDRPVGSWGEQHRPIVFDYASGALLPVVDVALSGDHHAISETLSVPGRTTAAYRGPVARVVWDVANRGQSRWGIPQDHSRADSGFDTGLVQVPESVAAEAVTEERVQIFSGLPNRLSTSVMIDDDLGVVDCSLVQASSDAETIARWAVQDRAVFWQMGELSVATITEIYQYLEQSPGHRCVMVRVAGRPVVLAHLYWPDAEPLGDAYDVQPGDCGVHVMSCPPDEGTVTPRLWQLLLAEAFADPRVLRLVAEPDAENQVAVASALRSGFQDQGEIVVGNPSGVGTKRARLVVFPKELLANVRAG